MGKWLCCYISDPTQLCANMLYYFTFKYIQMMYKSKYISVVYILVPENVYKLAGLQNFTNTFSIKHSSFYSWCRILNSALYNDITY